MVISLFRRKTSVSSKPQSSSVKGKILRRGFGGSRLFAPLTPLPKLACDLFLLSVRIALVILLSTARLVVPPSKKSLLGETVLITGAGHGIGRELAMQLAALGCVVVCWDTDVEANRDTMSIISKDGGEVHGFVVDVSKRVEVREAAKLMRKAGIPDVSILVNNAAILMHQPFLEHKDEDIQKIFDVNVLSQFWTLQAFLPAMLQNKKGHIVSMCSMCGFYGVLNKVPYCSSKFAIRGLVEGLHEELRLAADSSNINFTTVYPFYADTGLAKDPKYRFPYIFGAVSPKYAAGEVIRAIQRNYEECSIPRCLLYLDVINRVLPKRAMRLIIDFLANVKR
ncbi:estradiol 17-beta-dehydrogenase 11-like [Nasonia vitripennis]|uniref:Short-chain dehydrogenase/reductase 3 n=1 Tax=Nasonia vitripennis TaxID=7425 RepID=A0A7M7G2R1_NASVI|nr:estradiol 17-beta-dehydrogenase 11-like [Nasonia vitripennis]